MNADVVVIGLGNDFRRDDGVGPAVAAELARRDLPGVRVMAAIGDPAEILDAWTGASVAVVIDATTGNGVTPGRIRRWIPGDETEPAVVSSHALGLPQTYALAQALGQVPQKLVVFTVDVADVGHGVILTPAVAAAMPVIVEAILAELQRDS